MEKRKCLVTGGAGFIGSNLVKEMLKNNYRITVVDDLSTGRISSLEDILPQINFINDDFSSDEVIKQINFQKFDTIFHLAAIPRVLYSIENPYETTDNNVLKTIKLINASCNNIEKFIFSSSSSVYGGADKMPTFPSHEKNPKSPYAWQKSTIEDALKMFSSLHNLNSISLRYFNVFGPGQLGGSAYSTVISAWCHAIKNNQALRKDGTGEQSRDMCYIDNVVHANILADRSSSVFTGETFNVACGESVTNNQILNKFQEKFKNLNIKQAPFRKGDVMHTLADISDTTKAINYHPLVRFWDGLEKTFEWWNL